MGTTVRPSQLLQIVYTVSIWTNKSKTGDRPPEGRFGEGASQWPLGAEPVVYHCGYLDGNPGVRLIYGWKEEEGVGCSFFWIEILQFTKFSLGFLRKSSCDLGPYDNYV